MCYIIYIREKCLQISHKAIRDEGLKTISKKYLSLNRIVELYQRNLTKIYPEAALYILYVV